MIWEKLRELKRNDVIKASMWYIVCSFMTNALNFVTAPIFTRIMPKETYGEYSNFISWYGIISCIIGINLAATIMRAKYDFKDEFKSYITSMMLLATVHVFILYVIAWGFRDRLIAHLHMNMFYITLIFICSLFQIVNGIFQMIQRLECRYKTSVFLTLAAALMTSIVSVILVLCWDDKLLAKVVGSQVPALIIYVGMYIYFLSQWQRPRLAHWKYAYVIALPYIPHLLAGNMLSSLDRVMITDLRGAEETATYSVAGNCLAIMSIFSTSINMAILPWLAEKLYNKEYVQIKKKVNIALIFFGLVCSYLILLSKEVILILGGKRYSNAVAIMPPLVIGCMFQYIYTFYVSVEQFEKKTVGMAVGTLVAALANWGLNGIFIPRYGYVAAAYTTMVSYLFLFLVHYFLVWRLKLQILFDIKVILGVIVALGFVGGIASMLNIYLRYGLTFAMTVIILYSVVKMMQTTRY